MDDKLKEIMKEAKENIKKYAPEILKGETLQSFIEYTCKRKA